MSIQVKTNTKEKMDFNNRLTLNTQEESRERREACCHAAVCTCMCESDKYVTYCKCLVSETEKHGRVCSPLLAHIFSDAQLCFWERTRVLIIS